MSNESLYSRQHESGFDGQSLEREAAQERERLRESLEKAANAERAPTKTHEILKNSALERALPAKEALDKRDTEHRPAPNSVVTKKQRRESFDKTMREARLHMSPINRSFSRVIHAPVIEKMSDGLGKTVARPNALLAASVCAFLLTTALLYIARHYGYSLSGSETIAAFMLGWLIGLLYDVGRTTFGHRRTP